MRSSPSTGGARRTWAHKIEVITDEAAKLGLSVDQSLGPQYPPTVPSLNSFNQPEAEQQLIYGREFHAPGDSRSGALPAPTTTVPSVSTQLCGPAATGDEVLQVRNLGGFAPGDVVTVGSGATAEQVTITSIGDRLAECADLGVSEVANVHATDETVRNVARTTRLRTLVAQCADACDTSGAAQVLLDPNSVVDVTDDVVDSGLAYDFPAGNGNPWVLIDFQQAPSGLIAQRGGYTPTQPNYVVDHLSRGGVQIQADFWDEHILTDSVRANIDRIGRGAVFEDSLELGSAQKWTWEFLEEFEDRRGYDPTLLLPALAGAGIQGTDAPKFEFTGLGAQVRDDYRQTMSDLFVDEYVSPMQEWAAGHGLDFRVQPYGIPISSAAAAAATGIAEGESLNFGSPNPLGAEQDYRVLSGGAHLAGKDLVSTECCAVFQGGYRSSAAGPNVGGQFGQGGDGTQIGGRYSQGLLDSIHKAYAGGVNQLVWHGYAYRDAPKGVGTSGRDGGTWPGLPALGHLRRGQRQRRVRTAPGQLGRLRRDQRQPRSDATRVAPGPRHRRPRDLLRGPRTDRLLGQRTAVPAAHARHGLGHLERRLHLRIRGTGPDRGPVARSGRGRRPVRRPLRLRGDRAERPGDDRTAQRRTTPRPGRRRPADLRGRRPAECDDRCRAGRGTPRGSGRGAARPAHGEPGRQ